MKMKRVIACILALSMLFMFASCGKKPTDDDTSTARAERILYPEDDSDTETETDEESSEEGSDNSGANIESRNGSGEDESKNNSSKSSSKKDNKSSAVSSKNSTTVSSKKETPSKTESKAPESKTSSKESSSEVSSNTSSNGSSSAGSSSKADTDTMTDTDTESDTESDTETDVHTDPDTDYEPEKILVVYFSRAGEQANGVIEEGNTSIVANIIANYIGADCKEITPLEDNYPTTYQELLDYAKQEKETFARPAISEDFSNIGEYDTIFVGYPVWWSDLPMIMYTFFESYEFTDQTIIPFCTYGGTDDAGTFEIVKSYAANYKDGFGVPGEDAQNDRYGVRDGVITWLEGLGYGE